MNTVSHVRVLLAGAAAIAWGGAVPALAQEQVPPEEVVPQENSADVAIADSGTLEIVVEAQRRSQNLTDVPISVSAIQADTLAASGLNSVRDLTQVVPAMRIDQNGAYTAPTIRGVGSSIAGTGFSNNVAIYVDNFYNPSQSTTNSLFVNLERVEVLKGPQGTLFGRNATGGAVLMRLREPSFEPTVEGRISYGRYNTLEAAAYASTGVSDNLAIDISGALTRSDGFVTDVVTNDRQAAGYTNFAVRTALLWEPTDTISFKLAYQHSEDRDKRPYATNAVPFDGSVAGTPYTTGDPMSLGALVGGVAPTRRGAVANSGRTEFLSNLDAVYLTGTFDLGGAVLKSYTMYRDEKTQNYLDLDASSAPVFEGVFFLQNRTFSQEFNVSGSSDRLDWLAGLFYLNHKDSQGPFPVLFGPALVGGFGFPDGVIVDLYSAGVNIQAYAAYADLTYRLTDKLYATVGGRYSYEKSKAFWNVEPLAAGFGIGAGNPPGRVDFSNDWQDFSPRAVLRYELTPNSNIYASYSRGFKSGLLTPNGFTTTPLNPEKLDAFEIGYKYGDPRLQIALAAYYYDYKDQQLASFVSGTGVYVTADSKIYGAEASVTARITDALRVSAGLAYTHARYTEFPLSASYAPTPSGIFAATNVNAKGFQTQRSPDWTGNIAVDYEHPVGNDYTIGFNANAYFSSKFPFDTAEVFYEGAYALVNASVGFGPADKSWRISLYGRNLTDTEYRTQVLPGDFAIQQVFGEPLTYGAMVAFDF